MAATLTGILALYGVGMVVWLVGSMAKSAMSTATDTKPNLKPISISFRKSVSGRCMVENEGYYDKMKKFIADVVCPELDAKAMAVADTKEELEQKIMKVFEHYEWRLSKRRK